MKTCIDCKGDISHRANNAKRCEPCQKVNHANNQARAEWRFRKKRDRKKATTNMVCRTCGGPIVEPLKFKFCSAECEPACIKSEELDSYGPTKPTPKKMRPCKDCGNPTVNRFYCPRCLEARESDVGSEEFGGIKAYI